MFCRSTARRVAVASAACALSLVHGAGEASAGEFQVANCQSDSLNFSTRAFGDFATRGMQIKRACNPEGPGLRGLITSNVVRAGRVPRGSQSLVTLSAPPGTHFTSFRWAGTAHRRDCRYALQLYADAPQPDAPRPPAISIKNVRANDDCPRPARAKAAGYKSRTYDVSGATRIVQRVVCVGGGGRQSCSARGSNYIRTYKAMVGVADGAPPAVSILPDTPLARGEWVSGSQPLNYDAVDNAGVRLARAFIGGRQIAFQNRACAFAGRGLAYSELLPCANGPGQITVNTKGALDDGTHQVVIQAEDTAGNPANSGVGVARVDNTPPARVDVGVEGGQEWRNRNDFTAAWVNPLEPDRAPIIAAGFELCPAAGGPCTRGEHVGNEIARFAIPAPGPGQFSLRVWLRDAAGNQAEDNASVPVILRYDPEPPQLGFEPPPATDPTRVSVLVTDPVSGIAGGQIEISREGSGTWQTLATQLEGDRLVSRIDDVALPAGAYALRARAADRAGNEASSDRRVDGQPMLLGLPLRRVAALQAGVVHTKVRTRVVRRRGKRRTVRERVTQLRPAARVTHGRPVRITGRLADPAGTGIAEAEVRVFSRSNVSSDQLIAVTRTDANGDFAYTATAGTTSTLRFVYAGSPLTLPAQGEVGLRVPAASSLRVTRRRVLNGQAVTFRGRLRTQPVPAGGKLVELQVRLSGRWQTFRTMRTDPAGQWAIRYRFKRTRGVQRFRFRLALPRETGYPFEPGVSRLVKVRVRGPA